MSGWRETVARGDCRECGEPRDTKGPRCSACLSKHRVDYLRRVKSGVCVKCKRPATAGGFCFEHWVRNISSRYRLNKANGGIPMLIELWNEQKGRCAVTGVELIPGVNASLDHIIPVSKGGGHTKANLRWVLVSINLAKADMTDKEFVEMCRLVVRAQTDQRPVGVAHAERSN